MEGSGGRAGRWVFSVALVALAAAGAYVSVTGLLQRDADPAPLDGDVDNDEDALRMDLAEPCPRSRATVELGSPYRGREPATFRSSGGTVFVTARSFNHGGIFDPDVGLTAIYVGPQATPPTYDRQSGRVANVATQTRVREGTWSAIELPRGRFWLWSTTGGDVLVRSCERRGVSDPEPAVPLTPQERIGELRATEAAS